MRRWPVRLLPCLLLLIFAVLMALPARADQCSDGVAAANKLLPQIQAAAESMDKVKGDDCRRIAVQLRGLLERLLPIVTRLQSCSSVQLPENLTPASVREMIRQLGDPKTLEQLCAETAAAQPNPQPTPMPAEQTNSSVAAGPSAWQLRKIGELKEQAQFSLYMSLGIAAATVLLIGMIVLWASTRINALQNAAAGMRHGLTGVFTRQVSSRISGASTGYGGGRSGTPIMLTPVGGGRPLALDARRLRGGGLIAGRNDGCDVVLTDRRASGRHARFWVDDAGTLRVEDLGSSNGTWRNGQKVLKASIRPGDVLKIGDSEYQL